MNSNLNADLTMLPVGSTLQEGKYRIERHLSSGGFGNTYLATNTSFEDLVAIKEFFMKDVNQRLDDSTTVSLTNTSQNPVFQEQLNKFKKEAKRLRSLRNSHIVSVSDLFDENGTAYYVMDFIDGQSLRDMVTQRGHLEEQEALSYLIQTLDALEEVHQHRIFHLDIKPANIMVDKTGHASLIDFGASKQQSSEGGATAMSAICYSPGYAPIEQKDREFEKFGPWTDLYSLGATIYNALTGTPPPSTSKIADRKADAFIFPSTVSEDMKRLIVWMMEGRRFDRPQSVSDVKTYLKEHDMLNVDHTFGASPIVEDVHDEGSQSGNTDLSGVTDPYGEKEEKTTRSISLFAKRFWAVMKVAIVIAIACVALYALYYKISNKEATPTELTPTDTIMPTEKPDSAVSPVIEDTGLDSTDTLASEEPEVL